jgi:hypothetical protein
MTLARFRTTCGSSRRPTAPDPTAGWPLTVQVTGQAGATTPLAVAWYIRLASQAPRGSYWP